MFEDGAVYAQYAQILGGLAGMATLWVKVFFCVCACVFDNLTRSAGKNLEACPLSSQLLITLVISALIQRRT